MKKNLLTLILVIGIVLTANAQPANDECTTAQNIGALNNPAPCPGTGQGTPINIAGTIVGATEGNPYQYQAGCSGAGGPNMGVPANDVWYIFTATASQLVLTINSTFATPNVAVYSGTCGALGGGVGGCAVGAGGTVSLTVEQMVIGTSYYVQVSGNTGETGTFNMSIQNNQSCSDCMLGSNVAVNPLPVNGAYQPGQVVNFCYTITTYSQENTNWLHGVQVDFGPGWAGISNQVPAAVIGGSGTWDWYPSCTSTANGQVFGQGFYIDLDGNGDPGDNFGDNCDAVGTGIPCPNGTTWTFCWDLTVAAGCSPGSDLSVTINTSGDGESGAWYDLGCSFDPSTVLPAVGACCPPNMSAVNISCPGSNDGEATATPVGAAGPYDYSWSGPGGFNASTNGVAGANTITNLSSSGVYTVTITDNNLCLATATVTVNAGNGGVIAPGNTGPYCEGETISLNVGAGFTDWDWTGPNGYVQNDTQNPTIPASTQNMSGIYTVTVTTAGGCTATGTTTVTVNPGPPIIANNTGPYCSGASINLSSPAGANDYDWTGPGGYVQNNTQNPVIPASTTAMSGVYTVMVTYAGGCTSSGTTTVTVNQTPTAQFTGDPLLGCVPLCVTLTDQSNGNGDVITSWNWNVETQNPILNQNANLCLNNPGLYDVTLTVSTAAGCTASLTAPDYINVGPDPSAAFIYTPQEIMELHPDVTFASTSTGATSWLWSFGDGAFSDTENPIHAYADTGTFCITLVVSNVAGCTDTATGCLYIKPDYSLFIPNTFTVNGDGLNEMWKLYGRGVNAIEVRIFDRWGEELYSFNDLNKGWPGTRLNGSWCKQDVYVYRVVATDFSNNQYVILGNVNLIR